MACARTLALGSTTLSVGRGTLCTLVGLAFLAVLRGATIAFFGITTRTLFRIAASTFISLAAGALFGRTSIALFSGLTLGGRTPGSLVSFPPCTFLRSAPLTVFGFKLRQFLRCLCGATRMFLGLGLFLTSLLLTGLFLRSAAGAFFRRTPRALVKLTSQTFLCKSPFVGSLAFLRETAFLRFMTSTLFRDTSLLCNTTLFGKASLFS